MKLLFAILCELFLLVMSQRLNKTTPPTAPASVVIFKNTCQVNDEASAPATPVKKPGRKNQAVRKPDSIIEPKKITFVDSTRALNPRIKITKKDDK